MSGVSLSWALATAAIACKLDVKPLPLGQISSAEVGRWRLSVNNSTEAKRRVVPGLVETDLPAFEVLVEHLDYLVFGLLGPAGGMIGGGATEDDFIDAMVEYLPADELRQWDDELYFRKVNRT